MVLRLPHNCDQSFIRDAIHQVCPRSPPFCPNFGNVIIVMRDRAEQLTCLVGKLPTTTKHACQLSKRSSSYLELEGRERRDLVPQIIRSFQARERGKCGW